MEHTLLENDFVLVYKNQNILNRSFHESGKLVKSTNGEVNYFISKDENLVNDFILQHNLKPIFEGGAWDFDSKFRFKISQIELIEDDNLFQLLTYAKSSNEIKYKIYASEIVIYVNYFFQPHLDLILQKNIEIEKAEGVEDIIINK